MKAWGFVMDRDLRRGGGDGWPGQCPAMTVTKGSAIARSVVG
jgi:hypothetical protein